jgi:putative SOS response-associated peptidase YedK
MCGRFTLMTPMDELVQRFRASKPLVQWTPRYNAAPTQDLLIITQEEPRRISVARWGLVPAWAKDVSIGSRMINARAETLAEKPAFKTLLAAKRCLVLADGFYEWKAGPVKTPFLFQLRTQEPFAFAGLWDEWRHNGETLRTFTIITTDPNNLLKEYHNRMPVILPQQAEATWLTGNGSVSELLKPFDADEMTSRKVSTRVNSPAAEGPELLVATTQNAYLDRFT